MHPLEEIDPTQAYPTRFPDLTPFRDFESAADAVLDFLQSQFGFRLWMITRVEGDDFIVLYTRDRAGAVPIGPSDVLRWSDTLCTRMVRGDGPRVAPRSLDVPAYAEANATEDFGIAAYVGVPLATSDGRLFGTLCAVDSIQQPAEIEDAQPIIELCAQMLSTLLDREQHLERERRARERAEHELDADDLTGVLSRRAWERVLASEEARCRRTGAPVCVIVGDLDELKETNDLYGHAAGDELLLFAGRLLSAGCRESDVVGRLGGDEFGVISPETSLADGEILLARVRAAFDAADISMSFGIAQRDPRSTLTATRAQADHAMLRDKVARKSAPR